MDRLGELEAFVAVADTGAFTPAGKALGRTTSSISKQVRALEERLGVRLLNRTTRRVSLTELGTALHERARGVLDDLEAAELAVSQLQETPRGVLRVSAPMDFGRIGLARSLARFAAQHSKLELEVELSDRFVNVVEEGFDVVVRIANLEDSSLVARRLGLSRRVLCAAPSYLDRRGRPTRPEELREHEVIGYRYEQRTPWVFRSAEGGSSERVSIRPRHRANNGELMRSMLLEGLGLALLPTFIAGPDLESGRLEPLLLDRLDADAPIWAMTAHRKLLAAKVRLLLDHLAADCGEHPPWDGWRQSVHPTPS